MFARPHYGGYHQGRWHTNYTGQTSTVNSTNAKNPLAGFVHTDYFDANSRVYIKQSEMTIAAQDKGYFLVYGIAGASSNGRQELFYFEDQRCTLISHQQFLQ